MAPATPVPARGAQRRLRALSRRGWSAHQLALQLGVHTSTVDTLLHADGEYITATGHQVVAELFAQLWASEPPQHTATQRREAELAVDAAVAHGWAAPLAWDDIDEDDAPLLDEPATEPIIDDIAVERAIAGIPTRLTREERLVAIHQLCDEGLTVSEIAKTLHANFTTTRDAVTAYTAPQLTEAA